MVQGECVNNQGFMSAMDRGQDAKRAGFQSLQKKCQDQKGSTTSAFASGNAKSVTSKPTSDKSGYGSWGPQFKNADHFKSMHNY